MRFKLRELQDKIGWILLKVNLSQYNFELLIWSNFRWQCEHLHSFNKVLFFINFPFFLRKQISCLTASVKNAFLIFGVGSKLLYNSALVNQNTYSIKLNEPGRYPFTDFSNNIKLIKSISELNRILLKIK